LFTGERSGYYSDFGSVADVAKAISQGYVYDGRYSRYRRRIHGRPLMGLSGHRFVGFLQNHDQIGNRALGERLGHLISTDRLKIAAALLFTAPFVPMLFQGEEWNASTPFQYFTDHTDPKLAESVREGRRAEFAHSLSDPSKVPDPQAQETFERSKLNWDEHRAPAHSEILDWYRALIALRRSVSEFSDGRLKRTAVKFDDTFLQVSRGRAQVICNLSDQPAQFNLNEPMKLAMSSKDIDLGASRLGLPPTSVAILLPLES
jgi:maltooligosyltrehalose trehalohydrolase